jgi:hypothetical protein
LRRQLQRLPTGAGAGVRHPRWRRVHQKAQQLASLVLNLKQPLAETRQGEGILVA